MSHASSQFQNATRLRDSGRWEEAAREFHRLATQTYNGDEKAALLINEHRCYCDAGRLDEAERILKQIRELAPDEPVVRLIVDFGEACMNVQAGQPEKGLQKFEEILHRNVDLLQDSHRYLYESIQKRRGVAGAKLGKHANAIPILKEASEFKTLIPEDKQEVHFFLGLCYDELRQSALAKEQYNVAIDLGIKNEFEAHAHYRIGVIYFTAAAFAQAKRHLETVLENFQGEIPGLPRRYVYEQLSRTCTYLGEQENAEKYMKMAQLT